LRCDNREQRLRPDTPSTIPSEVCLHRLRKTCS